MSPSAIDAMSREPIPRTPITNTLLYVLEEGGSADSA